MFEFTSKGIAHAAVQRKSWKLKCGDQPKLHGMWAMRRVGIREGALKKKVIQRTMPTLLNGTQIGSISKR